MNNKATAATQALRGPILLLTLGFLFELHQTGTLTFQQTWPLLIIVVGVMKFLERAVAPPKAPVMPGQFPKSRPAPPTAGPDPRMAQPDYGVPPQYGAPPGVPTQYGVPPQSPYGVPPNFGRPTAGSPKAARVRQQRAAGAIGGPLIMMLVGVAFLAHTISPEVPLGSYLARYWPWLLVVWGGIQILEILLRAPRGTVPVNGISAGGWFMVILICFFGLASYELRGTGDWWRRAAFQRGVEVLGTEHDYQVAAEKQEAGPAPQIVLESFRGSAHITGGDGTEIVASGHKTVRSLDIGQADRTDRGTPLTIEKDGSHILIRCNQDHADSRTLVTTDLDLTVPRGASIQVTDRSGDLEVSSLDGNVDITDGSGGVTVSNIAGNVSVDTRHADSIRCSAIKGAVQLRGHGSDVDLENIAGQVTVSGDYDGTIALRELLKPIRVESMHTEVDAQQLPGELKIEPGSVTGQNLVGPLNVTTRATDVDLNGFTEGLNLTVEKGDIELRPSNVPLSKMLVRTRAGNIDLALPDAANFQLQASTRRGEIENDFGGDLTETNSGHGAQLKGSVGSGPDLMLETTRGTITLRKASSDEQPPASAGAPHPRPGPHPHPLPKSDQMPSDKTVEL